MLDVRNTAFDKGGWLVADHILVAGPDLCCGQPLSSHSLHINVVVLHQV